MDLPALSQQDDTLHLYVSGYGANAAWRGGLVERSRNGEWVQEVTFNFRETFGVLVEELPTATAGLDLVNSVLVTMSDDNISTITQADFDAGGNLCSINDELVQFKTVVAEGDDYRISYLKRGCLHTTPATHAIADTLVNLTQPTKIPMVKADIGQAITFRVHSNNTIAVVADEVVVNYVGNSQIEWYPINATMELISGDWLIDWAHNKRIGAPGEAIISDNFLDYYVLFDNGVTTKGIYTTAESLTYTEAEQIVDFGAAVGSWTSVKIYGNNNFTGLGEEATVVSIAGDKLLFEDGSGYLMFEDDSGVLLLE